MPSPFTFAAEADADDWNSMPQKTKTTAMAPRNSMANQPEILSRIFCSIGVSDGLLKNGGWYVGSNEARYCPAYAYEKARSRGPSQSIQSWRSGRDSNPRPPA